MTSSVQTFRIEEDLFGTREVPADVCGAITINSFVALMMTNKFRTI